MPQNDSSPQIDTNIEQITAQAALEQALAQLLQAAQSASLAGNVLHAIAHYKLILENIPDHAEANFRLAELLLTSGAVDEAVLYLEAAIQAYPQRAEFWDTYIQVLELVGDAEIVAQAKELRSAYIEGVAPLVNELSEALPSEAGQEAQQAEQGAHRQEAHSAVSQVVSPCAPVKPAPVNKRDSEEIAKLTLLFEQANFKELERLARKLIQKNANNALAWRFLGLALLNVSQLDSAEQAMLRSLELLPGDAIAHFNFALVALKNKKLDVAERHYRIALDIDDKMLAAYNNLANLLRAAGKLEEAEICLRKLLVLAPEFAIASINLVGVLRERKLFLQALEIAQHALSKFPNMAEAHHALGSVLSLLDRGDEALPYLLRAIELNPRLADAYNNIGSIYLDKKDFAIARPYFEKTLEIDPDSSNAYRCLGQICISLDSDIEAAEQHFRNAIACGKNASEANTCLLFCLSETGKLNPQQLFQEHLNYSARYEIPLMPAWPRHENVKDKERILKIGFVSGDFHNHAVATFALPVLEYLSRITTLELYAYDNNAEEDEVTSTLRTYFKHWRKINKVDDEVVVTQILNDRIDILCDLSGHTAKNRLLVFAHKPAPIQFSWIGYPGTTGLRAMDYFIGDQFYLPAGRFDHLFTEKIANLPCAAPFLPSPLAPEVKPLPALDKGHFSFGSFNRISKINEQTVQAWSNLLKEVENSSLLIAAMPSGFDSSPLLSAFAENGISAERISFYGRTGVEAYLNLYNQIDLCLDSFPFNGGTTTHHGLWMGVPTLSIDGSLLASRSAAAILGQVGMQGFLAKDLDDFVVRGKYWCSHLDNLSAVRMSLRTICENSIKCKPELIAANLDQAMRKMWVTWCDGEAPVAFSIPGADN